MGRIEENRGAKTPHKTFWGVTMVTKTHPIAGPEGTEDVGAKKSRWRKRLGCLGCRGCRRVQKKGVGYAQQTHFRCTGSPPRFLEGLFGYHIGLRIASVILGTEGVLLFIPGGTQIQRLQIFLLSVKSVSIHRSRGTLRRLFSQHETRYKVIKRWHWSEAMVTDH